MTVDRREALRRSLRTLAEPHAATLRLMEETYALLADELALDPLDGPAGRAGRTEAPAADCRPVLDDARLTVTFRGRDCYLGATLPFRILARLARRPNAYVTHDDLLADAWDGAVRSDGAIRSAVKVRGAAVRPGVRAGPTGGLRGPRPGRDLGGPGRGDAGGADAPELGREAAWAELGTIIGFKSQRPEVELSKGPDGLWAMPGNHYLLVEAKSEVDLDREEIYQSEAEQISNSANWFTAEYGENTPVSLLMIHPTAELADSAYPPANTMVMTPKKLGELHTKLRAFATALAAKPSEAWTTADVGALLASHQLDAPSVRSIFCVPVALLKPPTDEPPGA
ncbi:hypothetical protein J0H58_08235 [bacterium]|nr:hypothetical protein [bacterium]